MDDDQKIMDSIEKVMYLPQVDVTRFLGFIIQNKTMNNYYWLPVVLYTTEFMRGHMFVQWEQPDLIEFYKDLGYNL